MKALTICQPYAHLICLPDDDDRAKRVENRTWETCYRGSLLIHAGKSRKFLRLTEDKTRDADYGLFVRRMAFGAIVGVAQLAGCFYVGQAWAIVPQTKEGFGRIPAWALTRWPWLAGHPHVEGPYCWVLREVRAFEKPIPYRGAQGLFDVSDEVMEGAA